ncbi:MAG TPA: respiratory nitrate reductase subunit gamma [Streptosporangiaceae bacterium]
MHAASAWLIWAVWPFSRLVHAWSVPLWYLQRRAWDGRFARVRHRCRRCPGWPCRRDG